MGKKLICLFTALVSLLALMLGGCRNEGKDPWEFKKEDQGFYYCVIGDNGSPSSFLNKGTGAVILGLVDEETEIEELVIPEKLGGYTVKEIGAYSNGWYFHSSYEHCIYSKNINRIIINYDFYISEHGFQGFRGDLIINVAPKRYGGYSVFDDDDKEGIENVRYVQINAAVETMPDYDLWQYYVENGWQYFSNHYGILFDAFGGEQTTFAAVIKFDELLEEPPAPTKNGYKFAGWYSDENYEKRWDFETDIVTENMTLYAKWIEN